MYEMLKTSAQYCAFKVDSLFKRVFKEQAGGAEIIATIVIIGIVLVLALAFRQQLTDMVKELWNSMVVDQETEPSFSTWD